MLVLVAIALAVSGVAGTYSLNSTLVNRIDVQLEQTVKGASNECESPYTGRLKPGLAPLVGYYQQCLDDTGQPVGDPRVDLPLPSQSPPVLPALNADTLKNNVNTPFTVDAKNGGSWRVLIAQPPPNRGHPTSPVLIAVSLDETDGVVTRQTVLVVVMGVVVLALLALLAYFMVRSSLRPLVVVEQTAEAIAAGDLTRRVPEADPRTEVGGLAQALNVMLGQIETAFDDRRRSEEDARTSEARMRRFIADASHELRTPLTSIRGFAELYRQNGGSDPEVNRIIGRIEHHATRMGVLVEDLLLLARLDQQRPLDRRPVDLLALATDAVLDARVTAPDHTLRLRVGGNQRVDDEDETEADAPVVLGDEVRLRQVLGNLLTNAVTHTPAGTEITVTVRTEGDEAILEVADNGPGMSADDASRIFERFYRTDPSRARAHGGAGLGLSIVHALVVAHGGDVAVATAPGQGATFRVHLPLAR
jgi:two-component system, OmpR family, sensor kinase